MDAVFPLKRSGWEDAIRYSVRGLERFGRGLDRIFIAGYKPEFFEYGKRIIHIPHTEKTGVPLAARMWEKLFAICSDERVSDEFLLMNDDFFFLKEFSAPDFPFFHRGSFEQQRETDSDYRRQVINTLEFLRGLGFTDLHYGIHLPIRIDKRKFIATYKFFSLFDEFDKLLPRLCYGNYQQPDSIRKRDRKIKSLDELADIGESELAFSTADEAECDELGEVLNWFYRKKPEFEKMRNLFQSEKNKELFVTDEDSAATLDKRYTKPKLLAIAKETKTPHTEDNNKKEIALSIITHLAQPIDPAASDSDDAEPTLSQTVQRQSGRVRVRVICAGTLGPKLLKKNDITDDPRYVALLETERGRTLVEKVK